MIVVGAAGSNVKLFQIMLTIWGTNAEKFHKICEPGSVIAFKRARISDYSGRSLDCSCLSSATFKVISNAIFRILTSYKVVTSNVFISFR